MHSPYVASLVLSFVCAAGCTKGSYVGDGGDVPDGGDVTLLDSSWADAPPSTTDASVPAQTTEALYFGVCFSKLAAGRIDRVLRFYTKVKATPTTVTVELTALKLAEGGGPPATVSKSGTVGQTYTVTNAPRAASGVYAPASLGTITIPGAANPISGRDIVVEQAAVPGKLVAGKFCSQLSGQVVSPTAITLEGADNTCIYFPVQDGDPTPVLQTDLSDFPATCALN